MWVEAIVSLEDFQALAAELLPVRVQLGSADSENYLLLSAAREVSLVAGRGLRVVCNAQIRWPVLGMDLPINVDRLTVMLEPTVPDEGGELLLGVQLEYADVAWVPSMLDRKIVSAVNDALKKNKSDLAWSFAETLSHDFPLPKLLEPVRSLGLKAGWGKVRVTDEAMVLVISFQAHAIRADGSMRQLGTVLRPVPALHSAAEPASLAARTDDRPGPGLVALGTAVGVAGTYLAVRLVYGLFAGSSGRGRRWV